MPYTLATKLQTYYEKSGSGEKLLFIGGVGGDLRSRPNVFDSPLPNFFEVLAFDQRGTGRSEKPANSYTMLDYMQDAVSLLDELKWSQCLIVGVSFGGMVAQELAIRHPQRVRAMALTCTSSGGSGGSSFPLHEIAHLSPRQRSKTLLGVMDLRLNSRWQADNPEEAENLISIAMNDIAPFLTEPGGPEGFARQVAARSQHNTFNRLDQIRTPTLVCAGRHDGQAPMDVVTQLQKRINGSTLKVFEGGHGFLAQDPSAYTEIIKFLSNANSERKT